MTQEVTWLAWRSFQELILRRMPLTHVLSLRHLSSLFLCGFSLVAFEGISILATKPTNRKEIIRYGAAISESLGAAMKGKERQSYLHQNASPLSLSPIIQY